MRFEPLEFINLATKNGINLSRIGNNIMAENVHGEWITVIKKHKRKLLKHLPDHEIQSLQRDIFQDDFE